MQGARSAEIRQAAHAYRDSLATAQIIARVIEAAQGGRWLRGAGLALARPRAWRFLTGSLMAAAGKRSADACAPPCRARCRSDKVSPMRLCLCICTCERPAGLAQLLTAIDRQRLGGRADAALRILVVDNGRSDAAIPVVEAYRAEGRFPITYAREPVRGLAAVRNRSLDAAATLGADWIALIDDDEVPDPDWLRSLLDTARRTGVAACVGPVVPLFERVPRPGRWPAASSPRPCRSATGW